MVPSTSTSARRKNSAGRGDGVNPEQLFATGYAACFIGAMKFVASQGGPKVPADTAVTATVGIGPRSEGGFGLDIALEVSLPGLARGKPKRWLPKPTSLPLLQRHAQQRRRKAQRRLSLVPATRKFCPASASSRKCRKALSGFSKGSSACKDSAHVRRRFMPRRPTGCATKRRASFAAWELHDAGDYLIELEILGRVDRRDAAFL